MPIQFIEPVMDGKDLKIGIVMARFNEWATEGLFNACLAELKALGVQEENIVTVTVPGALEVPFALTSLYDMQDFDAMIAIGCVIRGETYHFELVSNESARGITDMISREGISIANVILTVENEEQARVRIEEKGRDGARVAVEMGNLRRRVQNSFNEEGEE